VDIAQYDMGKAYMSGKYVEHSETKAIEMFRMAAQQGYVGALYNLGCVPCQTLFFFPKCSVRHQGGC
jgi:TPR repeat protein